MQLNDPVFSKFNYMFSGGKAYFECDDGWDLILYELLEKIHKVGVPIQIDQIKEKFGTLRVYYHALTEDVTNSFYIKIDELIQEAEDLTCKTCEVCGRVGQLTNLNGWYKTLCEEHFKEMQNGNR